MLLQFVAQKLYPKWVTMICFYISWKYSLLYSNERRWIRAESLLGVFEIRNTGYLCQNLLEYTISGENQWDIGYLDQIFNNYPAKSRGILSDT